MHKPTLTENCAQAQVNPCAGYSTSDICSNSAMHTFITARLERIGAYHEQLASLVGETRATQLVIELEELPPEENPPG